MANKFLIFLIVLGFNSYSQNKKTIINDFSVILHEEAINKVIAAIGDIKGTNDYEVLLISGKYHWTVQNPKINIRPDSSDFTCDALVNVGPFNYKTQVVGIVKITYDNEKNLIFIKISRAIFELYTMLFGKKIHIKDIHLEDYFKEPFAFEGPKTMATNMEFMMPDSTMKKIYVQPTDCKMELKWKEICTSCEIVAADAPFRPTMKLVAPIEATKTTTTSVPQKK
ncbi:MAG: hypothetical protein Q7W45_07620 [Bacteroidota bacterium]|nr:hypothetical protein [Bacteroidota bacterium]MDP3144009.1 hypothetical protein [Bacteroidota bacterium]